MATTGDSVSNGQLSEEGSQLTSTVLEIENTVLLENWTLHGLDDDAW